MKAKKRMVALLTALMLLTLVLFTGCESTESTSSTAVSTAAAPSSSEVGAAEASSTSLTETGFLTLSVNPEIQIEYDKDGVVTALTGKNDDGKKVVDTYQDYVGKPCSQVLEELITKIYEAGYFVDDIDGNKKNIVLQLEPGSVLPSDHFLEDLSQNTQEAVKGLDLTSGIVTVDDDDYDPKYAKNGNPSPYITLEKAKEIALTQAGVDAADAVFEDKEFDFDDGYAIFELEFRAGGNKYEYDVDALTGKVLKAEHEVDRDDQWDDYDDRYDDDYQAYVPSTQNQNTGSSSSATTYRYDDDWDDQYDDRYEDRWDDDDWDDGEDHWDEGDDEWDDRYDDHDDWDDDHDDRYDDHDDWYDEIT